MRTNSRRDLCHPQDYRAVAAIAHGLQDKFYLGNLDAKRDWGHARDFVEGMWLIVQQPQPDDYVLATGEVHSVREFVEEAFACIKRKIEWTGSGLKEKGIDDKGKVVVEVDPSYFRPTEVDMLVGDASKARQSSVETQSGIQGARRRDGQGGP